MLTEVTGARTHPGSNISSRLDTLIGAIVAALLGAFLVWGVGFSPIAVVHSAAHDTRHSNGFPCH
jgi:cobalt transporter subunit CbtB